MPYSKKCRSVTIVCIHLGNYKEDSTEGHSPIMSK